MQCVLQLIFLAEGILLDDTGRVRALRGALHCWAIKILKVNRLSNGLESLGFAFLALG